MDATSSSSSWKGMMEQGNEPHVLAVDDNIIDRKIVEKLLKNSSCKGTQLLSLHSNHSLIDYCRKWVESTGVLGLGNDQDNSLETSGSKVNLIITDYCMPGMTGYDLLKKVKQESNAMKEVPVVLRGRSSNVHAKASQTIRRKKVEMPIDDKKLKLHQ
ncbi:hypothetical protein C3L33_03896, partial [Rhododendron williamsianum]